MSVTPTPADRHGVIAWVSNKTVADITGKHSALIRKLADSGAIRALDVGQGHRRYALVDALRLIGLDVGEETS
jgi:hypothetical protein